MAEGGGLSGLRPSPSFDNGSLLTPPRERSTVSSAGGNLLNPRGSHSLSRLTPGLASPTIAALQRFATYSPRHDFPSPPPSPITLRSLRVRDDAGSAAARAALRGHADDSAADELPAVDSTHHPHHPVRKRLSQRLAAWSKNFKSKFKKSAGGSGGSNGGVGGESSSPSSSIKLSSDLASLKHELLMDRVVASDGRSCTLTRRHQLSSDLPALLRSSSTSPRPGHQLYNSEGDSSAGAGGVSARFRTASGTGVTGGGGGGGGAFSQPVAVNGRSRRDPRGAAPTDSRTPVGMVQSSAFIVTTSSSSPKSSPSKMMSSVVIESASRIGSDSLSTSIRSEGGVPTGGVDLIFDRNRRGRPCPAGTADEERDDEGEEEDEGDDDEGEVVPPPELPPRRRRVQSTDNILDLPGERSLSATSQITTSLTTDDVASLREGGTTRSSSDVFARSIERLKECGWYWGPLSWEEASIILKDKLDGSFLVRDSSDDRHILSISIRCNGRTLHSRIQHHKGLFSLWQQPWTHGCDTIVDFIERCMMHSRNGSFVYFLRPADMANVAPMPLLLLHPVSRLFKVPSLHHLARFAILKTVRRDFVDDLPLPPRLKEYLLEPQYLFEDLISVGEDEEEDGTARNDITNDVGPSDNFGWARFPPPPSERNDNEEREEESEGGGVDEEG